MVLVVSLLPEILQVEMNIMVFKKLLEEMMVRNWRLFVTSKGKGYICICHPQDFALGKCEDHATIFKVNESTCETDARECIFVKAHNVLKAYFIYGL